MNEQQVREGLKRLNDFFKVYKKEVKSNGPIGDNQSFAKRHGYTTATFYSMRKRLVDTKRLSKNGLVGANTFPVTKEEYLKHPYPYGNKRKARGKVRAVTHKKRVGSKSNGNALLDEPITFNVASPSDEIKISLSEFTRVIIELTRQGHIK